MNISDKNTNKIDKINKLINDTEDEDEKNLLIQYLGRKYTSHDTTSEVTKKDPIISIIEKENILGLKKILEKVKVDWYRYIFYSKTPLHLAIENGDKKLIELLLLKGHPLWIPNKKSITPFELACLNKDPGMLMTLINNGANIKKILYLREGNKDIKFFHCNIDFLLIAKKILIEENNINDIRNNLDKNNYFDLIGLERFTWDEFHYGLENFLKNDYPNLLFLYNDLNKSKDMDNYIIFYFLFDLDFNFYIENEKYFYLELDYNKNLYNIKNLEIKFRNDYKNIYPEGFINLIWSKYKYKKIKLSLD